MLHKLRVLKNMFLKRERERERERKHKSPILSRILFRNRPTRITNIIINTVNIARHIS